MQIGCGKVIFPTGQLIANQISHQFDDGSIDEISGLDFGWWSIWRKRLTNRVPRSKRQVEGSGEADLDEEDDEDYLYGDEDEDEEDE